MKPVFIPASPFSPAGWYVADRDGMPIMRGPGYRDRKTCLRAISELRART
ncbi:hypothetical protein Q8W71_07330 [Methylobacterium sp. NEAU 140]|nr:hypothetical protein [Methylobacterium sp. NEAU 140]MDP4022429.1 hypothetical protein [Methylobacterium sp. NEAU 140]